MMRGGFTLFELILVIAIIGILAVASLPIFFDISEESHDAAIEGVVGTVRDAIAIYRANDLAVNSGNSYPANLDVNAINTACTTCFSEILEVGLNDSAWRKESDATYTANDGIGVITYVYNSTDGTFLPQ